MGNVRPQVERNMNRATPPRAGQQQFTSRGFVPKIHNTKMPVSKVRRGPLVRWRAANHRGRHPAAHGHLCGPSVLRRPAHHRGAPSASHLLRIAIGLAACRTGRNARPSKAPGLIATPPSLGASTPVCSGFSKSSSAISRVPKRKVAPEKVQFHGMRGNTKTFRSKAIFTVWPNPLFNRTCLRQAG
jgi:hypothetical protein